MSLCEIDLELQLVWWKQLCIPLQKKKFKKWKKIQIYSLTSFSFSETVHLTISFLKYRPFAAKHASILSTHFLNGGFKPLLWNAFLGSSRHLFQSSSHSVHISMMKTTFGVMALKPLLHKSSHMWEHSLSWWRIHLQRSSGHFCQTRSRSLSSTILYLSYLSVFLENRYVDRPSLSSRRRQPKSVCQLTFADEPFSTLIRRYEAAHLPHVSF